MNLEQTLQAHGMLLSQLPSFFTKARPEDVELVAEIVKCFTDSFPECDDEAREAVFQPLFLQGRTTGRIEPWQFASISVLLDFVRDATHEDVKLALGLVRELHINEPSPGDWHEKPAFKAALFTHLV